MGSEIAASAASSGAQVTTALKRAGERTGAGFDFLMKTAMRESSLNPNAKAKTSSAAGLFQFIEQTWLGAVKQYGAAHGLAAFAADITQNAEGRYTVASEPRREEILNLRYDANAAAGLAGEIANENRSFLERRLGRAASAADLYAAHFLGPAGAVKLLSGAANAKAADLLPRAAAANHHVFYDGARKKTVGEVVAAIAKSMGGKASTALQITLTSAPNSRAERNINSESGEYTDFRGERNVSTGAHEAAAPRAAFSASSPLPSPFSAIALSVLQALDPTRLAARRDNDDNQSRERKAEFNSAAR